MDFEENILFLGSRPLSDHMANLIEIIVSPGLLRFEILDENAVEKLKFEIIQPIMIIIDGRKLIENFETIVEKIHRLYYQNTIIIICDQIEPFLIPFVNRGIIEGILLSGNSDQEIKREVSFILKRAKQEHRSQQILDELNDHLMKLNQIGMSLSVEHDLDKLLATILTEARRFTRSDAGSLYIVHHDHLSFELAQNDTLDARDDQHSEKTFKSRPLPLSKKSIAGYVALTGRILNLYDVYNLPKDLPFTVDKSFDQKTGYRTKSMLVIPMRDHRDQIIGVLQLINSLSREGKVVPHEPHHVDLVKSLASQAAVAIRNTSLIAEIKKLLSAIIEFSSSVIDARSAYTAGHSQRIAQLVKNIALAINEADNRPFRDINFSQDEMDELAYAAYLHDIGKIGVPEHILDKRTKISSDQIALIKERLNTLFVVNDRDHLTKGMSNKDPDRQKMMIELKHSLLELFEFINRVNRPGFLTDEDLNRLLSINKIMILVDESLEYPLLDDEQIKNLSIKKGNLTETERREIEKHIEYTINILQKIPFPEHLKNVPLIAAAHHEKLDGSGYPRGLKAQEIPLRARILAVADFFDALTAKDRPYKKPLSPEKTLEIMEKEALCGKLDLNIIELFKKPSLYQDIIDSDSDVLKTHIS